MATAALSKFHFPPGRRCDVGIGRMIVSDDPQDLLAALNLGSCLGVAVYDPKLRCGGLIHCLLPLSKSDPAKAEAQPYLYVDTGVSRLIEALIQKGSNKRSMLIYAAGGSAISDTSRVFEIGSRNITILRKLLWKNNMLLKASDVGGDCSRTVTLSIATGEVLVKKDGEWQELK